MPDDPQPTEPFRTFETEDDFRAFVQDEIRRAETKGRRIGEKAATKSVALAREERERLEALEAEKDQTEQERLAQQGEWEELKARMLKDHEKAITARTTEAETLRRELRQDRCHLELIRAAGEANAFNPEQVAGLLSSRVDLDDDGRPYVRGDDGKPRYSSADQPMTPSELVTEYLANPANANLVKAASSNGGSGARGSGTVRVGADQELTAMREQLAKLHEAGRDGDPSAVANEVWQLSRQIRMKEQELAAR